MTTDDFSLEFDLLFNNIASNKSPGLNEYEKSLLLTEAQELVIQSLYTGTEGGKSFEGSEDGNLYLSSLMQELEYTDIPKSFKYYNKDSYNIPLDEVVWYITLETATIQKKEDIGRTPKTYNVQVIPVTQDDFLRTVNNPFRGANKRRLIRLSKASEDTIRDIQIVVPDGFELTSYKIRYIEKPTPIVLEGGITIDGKLYDYPKNCKLSDSLHRTILYKAVELAKSLWT